ncbi:MAG: Cytochrome c-type biogenesis protein CcmF [Steroidobacteraceae bacterium]|nr:Cytochrome c-type biogenesis protein CcmF [Steroidobacteraceae bacterium]
MLPELGQFALILALLLAALQAFFGLAAPALGRDRWLAAVMPATAGQAVMVGTAFACLVASFVRFDFSVAYVAENSNSALPLAYRVAAVWGAHEGSLLLWITLLAVWTVAVAFGVARLPARFGARVLGVLGLVSFGFILFTLATSNPFLRLDPPVPDGRDLNPLLQDPALALHPPLLYTGYVGFAVAFAFAIAAMLEGRLDQTWAKWTRPWTLAAWAFLTCGIALGSWWAYYELGWGGYWFWDPVENASFMPWLIGTALIHSLAVTDKRGLFKSWTLLLAIIAFSLSLLGTFLVRSGVLVSVHSFAADPARGVFILAFLVIMIGGALSLYAWRAPLLRSNAGFEFASRESFLLFNNILLVIAAATVFGGTLAPLISDTLGLGTLSVGPQYFNPTFLLPMLPLIALVAIGMHANWKRGRLGERGRPVIVAGLMALAIAIALVFGYYAGRPGLALVSFALGAWLVLSSLFDPLDRLRRGLSMPRAIIGMTLAHVAVGVFVIAVTAVETYTVEQDIAMARGETAHVGGFDFRFDGVDAIDGPNYDGVHGVVQVTRDGTPVVTMHPEKRRYLVQQSVMTEAAIASQAGRDLFVALGEDLGAGRWSLRIQIRPLINYVWLAAALMALGGAIAASDRRYRHARAAAAVPANAGQGSTA